jgi:asparagine synthase (glutamine-hydrolysing)
MMTNLFSSREKQRLFRAPQNASDTLSAFKHTLSKQSKRTPLDQTLYLYCQSWLVDDLLMKADRMTMANSIELRVPFLDHRLVEWAAQAPVWMKVGKNDAGHYVTKRALRDFAKARLPGPIIDRPKQGFPVPVYGWLSGPLKDWARDLIGNTSARLLAYFEPLEIDRLLTAGIQAEATATDRHRLWNLLILELWMREWLA